MNPLFVWLAAVVLYGGFMLWYHNWRGPLTAEEIERFERRLATGAVAVEPERMDVIHEFLSEDDGREFFMVNLISLHRGEVTVEGTSDPPAPARKVLERYTGYFMPELFKRAGHPALVGPAAGGYIEAWGVEASPGWSFTGVIRYRSRRDMAELASDPRFNPAHVYKTAAIAHTFAFPAAPAMVFLGPRIWVGLVLALLASLAHLGIVSS